ncbi:globin domain-containing protein [Micromonospora sp. CB01531]|uniref:globin domain-containing protein n=1 Tax=Micromonospora sp. CB01531 TaxID=1718947 RepID=UPI00093A3618|nr:globin domain-containing protein [Micromonospora sp. CB01531]OKI54677.1 oxidoreductase [Micromonospora sp. CB01531]
MDIAALRQSWSEVAVAGPEAARYFYATLFVMAPETRSMFPIDMHHQEDKLFAALGHIIAHVDDVSALAQFTHRLGADHRRFSGWNQHGQLVQLAECHYIWVGQALLATLEHILGPRWTPALRAEWAAAYEAVAKLMLAGAEESAQVSPPYWEAEVTSVQRRRADICVFTVRPDYWCSYLPGQSLPTQVPVLRTWRYLSPANAPRSTGTLEFHVRAAGRFSTHLVRRLAVGDTLLLGHPVGTALSSYDRAPHRPLLLIAGGTGVAPLRAIVEQLRQGPGRPTTLVVGGRTPGDLYDHDTLTQLAASTGSGTRWAAGDGRWLRYVPTVETGWGWDGEVGTAVDTALRLGFWADADILVCGSPAMTQATITTLTAAGVQAEQILTDSYDHTLYPPLSAAPAGAPHDISRTGVL